MTIEEQILQQIQLLKQQLANHDQDMINVRDALNKNLNNVLIEIQNIRRILNR